MDENIRNQILELSKEGNSIRRISNLLSIPKTTVSRILGGTVSQNEGVPLEIVPNGTVNGTVKSRCPLGLDLDTCEKKKEMNSIGVVKLRVCDYNLEEQGTPTFKDMPYWDC